MATAIQLEPLEQYIEAFREINPVWDAVFKRPEQVPDTTAIRKFKGIPSIEIKNTKSFGRFLISSRNIRAGEVIFMEPLFILAPKSGANPTCLDCLALLSRCDWTTCSSCGAPRCKENCGGLQHTDEECKILAKFELEKLPKKIQLVKYLNCLISIIRTHLQMKKSKKFTDIIKILHGNEERRKKVPNCLIDKANYSKVLNGKLELGIDSASLDHITGVFDTNAFEVDIGNNREGRAIFPITALLNHSCIPNAQHWFFNRRYMVIVASTFIPKQTPICISYIQTFWGNEQRLHHVLITKLFRCKCPRCADCSELGTHFSSIKCKHCSENDPGYFVPQEQLMVDWICSKCNRRLAADDAADILVDTSYYLLKSQRLDLGIMKNNLNSAIQTLGIQHYVCVELQYCYIRAVLKSDEYGMVFFLFLIIKKITSIEL